MASPQDPSISPPITVSPPQQPPDGLLLKLLEACAKHKRHHNGTNDHHNDKGISDECIKDLSGLQRVLPRMEETIAVADSRWDLYRNTHNSDRTIARSNADKDNKKTAAANNETIKHLCALYRAIARSSFCPHASSFLFNELEVKSRIFRLVRYLIHDPVGVAHSTTNSNVNIRNHGEKNDGVAKYSTSTGVVQDIGNAIVALLHVLNDNLRMEVVHDLVTLISDLIIIEESGVLFDPHCQTNDSNDNGGRIRIQIFPHLDATIKIELVSRKSLLSLQLGVWIVLSQMLPEKDYAFVGELSGGFALNKADIIHSILPASRHILLDELKNHSSEEGWVYSDEDNMIHSLLILRTKVIVSDLLESIATKTYSTTYTCFGFGGGLGTLSSKNVTLALLVVESAKSHLTWNQFHSNSNIDSFGGEKERQINLHASYSISKFMLSALLVDGIWTHALPYLIDVLPYLVNNRDLCLPRVVLRILHLFLRKHDQVVIMLQRRCLACGYFTYLFQLTVHSSESITNVALSIVTALLEKSKEAKMIDCFSGINFSSEIVGRLHEGSPMTSIQKEKKRRRFLVDAPNSPRNIRGTSIHSILAHFVVDAISNGNCLVRSFDELFEKRNSTVMTQISDGDILKLRHVSGMLRVMISLRSFYPENDDITNATTRLFLCIQSVSQILIVHQQGGRCHIEPKLLKECLLLIASVGYHAYRVFKKSDDPIYGSERESVSNCIMATLPLIHADESPELDDNSAFELLLGSPHSASYCQNVCKQLCSVFGVKAIPPVGLCLCALGNDTSNFPLSRECQSFLLDEMLPLRSRCILLASLYPITADSRQHDTTLSSLQRFLSEPSRPWDAVTASLTVLPILLISIALSKQDKITATRYLLSLMESLDFQIVTRYCQSEVEAIRAAAFLTLAKLYQVYAAASFIVSPDDNPIRGNIRSDATILLWDVLNLADRGAVPVLLSMRYFNWSSTNLWESGIDLPSSLSLRFKSNDYKFAMLRQSPRAFLASHLYLRSTLATVSISTVRSFRGFEFFNKQEHYRCYDQVAQAVLQNVEYTEETHEHVPFSVWVLLAPFVISVPVANEVAKCIGPVLLQNDCKVLSALFVSEGKTELNLISKKSAVAVINKLFGEIEYLLIKFFRLPSALLTLGDDDSSPGDEVLHETGLEIAFIIFQSMCESAPLDSKIGLQVFQQSFLRLVRMWVWGTSNNYRTVDYSSFTSAGDAIKRLFGHRKELIHVLGDDFMASVLREFFLPSIADSVPFFRYQLLVGFMESCILPHRRSRGYPTHEIDTPNCFGVLSFVDKIYPSVMASMIFNGDIEGLEMCAAFKMYLLSEHKKQKRGQKKSGNELIVGKQGERDRSATFARDLVPGAKGPGKSGVSAKNLSENMKMLCWKSDVIEHVLPKLLLHSDRTVLKFFADLCPPNVSLSRILQEKELTVLKTLVWELGATEESSTFFSEDGPNRNDVVLALKMGYLIKEGHFLLSASDKSADAKDDSSVRIWVGTNFMYLLVNVVLNRWKSRSEIEKLQTIKCLKALLRYLSPADSLQFKPQIMVAIGNTMGYSDASRGQESCHIAALHRLAVSTLFDFVKILAAHHMSTVDEHILSIVVILFPLFEKEANWDNMARKEAVNLLEWLAENASASFKEIPFLPQTPDLKYVRDILASKGVFLDDINIQSILTYDDQNRVVGDVNTELHSKFYAQMNTLSDLIAAHENKEVRRVVILHMTKLIYTNRDLFNNMIENEELASMHFLTVVHGKNSSAASMNCGFVTKLLIRLLSRCVDESDRDIRDAIGCCLGEIGAIDPNRLGKEINTSQFITENDDSDEWRLRQPPWKSSITKYQLRLVTKHLVSGLKSATETLDQHKIGFAIQELLKQIDASVTTTRIDGTNTTAYEGTVLHGKREMSSWLKTRLDEDNVRCIVEPYWTSTYQQQDISTLKSQEFFVKSNTYFRWLSYFCRFLVTRSNSNSNSLWKDLFFACRSAIRSQAGIGVAEFILPVLMLDTICFGEKEDQEFIIGELLAALSFDDEQSSMPLREREKAVNLVLTILDVIRHWVEREMEEMNSPTRAKSKRGQRQCRHDDELSGNWPVEESISKINHFLKQVPLSTCATAASRTGMNARALRFLEIESRGKSGVYMTSSTNATQGPKYLKSQYIDGIDLSLTQTLLGKLDNFDTMVLISQKCDTKDSSLSRRLAREAIERELYGDIEGSCHAYEKLLDGRLNTEPELKNTRLVAQQGLLRCLLKLGRLDSVINQAYGMSSDCYSLNRKSIISNEFLPFASEASWRLGNWKVLDRISEVDLEEIIGDGRQQLCLARAMHCLHEKSPSKFAGFLHEAREYVMASLSSAARDSYSQSYPHLVQLHSLRELELAARSFLDKRTDHNKMLNDEWTRRLRLCSPDSSGSNAIVNTRLALCRMSNDSIAEGSLWLDVGKMARKGGLFQVAEQCLTHADLSFCASLKATTHDTTLSHIALESIGKVKLQFAKLKYELGESTAALNLIEDDIPSSVFHLEGKELKKFISTSDKSVDIMGRLLLQSTEWMVSDGLKSCAEIRSRYQTVLKLVPDWERAHFHFAKYLDMMYESCIAKSTGQMGHGGGNNVNRASAIGTDQKCQNLLIDSVNHYGISLQLGQKHVFQALPRLLALWLEFTAICEPVESASLLQNQSQVNKLIKSFIPKISEHLFYTALPQLVSCILHSNKESSINIMQILIAVLTKYPCQTVWSCNWLRFSKSEEKRKAGKEIFNGTKNILLKIKGGKQFQEMLDASKQLYEFLLNIAKHCHKGNATSIKMNLPSFNVPLTSFIPPIQSALSVTPGALDRSDINEVFPQFVPRMRAFNRELKVMQSKAKPKRVSMYAIPATATEKVSCLKKDDDHTVFDTGEMHFLIKQEAKGDLRKDSRVQDLNNVINRLLVGRKTSSGSDSHRQRLRLHLRTFSVVCLSEDCGILEWVPNTDSFRSLVGRTYNPQISPNSIHRHGDRITNYSNVELREAFMKCQDMYFKKGNLKGAAKRFDEDILQQYKPFMYWWFIQNFSNPHAWFEARNNFTLSAAVWSAVGHIIGLGDRHSENILVDTRTGECVHVDFDCIFDKGLLLPRPEVIPFRLTPNMIDAFGPTGADGLYTGALVESMKTLRQNKDTLLSVLEPFLKDPVINFSSSKNQQKIQTSSAKAADAIRKIEGRLKGIYNLMNPNNRKIARRDGFIQEDEDDGTHVALSVEGQVQKMIAEATSHENLVQVYVGWMPWI